MVTHIQMKRTSLSQYPRVCVLEQIYSICIVALHSNETDSSLNLNGFTDDNSIMKEFNQNLPVEERDTIDLLVHNLRLKSG